MSKGVISRNIMKAIRISQFGGPEVLKLENNVPLPKVQDNQVLVKVYAAGVNPVDTYIRNGTYPVKPTLPYTPGMDVAGIVESVGKNVKSVEEGDRVFSIRTVSGGYAEYCVADEGFVQRLDEKLTFEQGAGLGVPYYTAYKAVVLQGKARPGETILVHGASGGVGLACIQLARNMGMKVLGTAGSTEGMNLVQENGADEVFNHKTECYVQEIMKSTDGNGPDLIIEMLANANLEKDLMMIHKNGRIVVVGSRGTIEVTPRFLMGKECTLTGIQLMLSSEDQWKEMHAAIQAGMATGWVSPHVGKEYSIQDASQAQHEVINNTGAQGKIVIKM